MARKAASNSSRVYFTDETEHYIVEYNNCTDAQEKSKIFTEHLYYPFYKLSENIIHTFKFYHTDVDRIEDLKLDIITMLIEENKLSKFDPSKGFKAFSYFGTIIKRWLIQYCNNNYKRQLRQLPMTSYQDVHGECKNIEVSPTLSLSGFIDSWVADVYTKLDDLFPKEMDRKVADAILTVFKTRQDLQVLKKRVLYVYVREITGCETVLLTKVICKLKDDFYRKYQNMQERGLIFDESDIIQYL